MEKRVEVGEVRMVCEVDPEDYDRADGEVWGIMAEVELTFHLAEGFALTESLRSPGCWGIQIDGDPNEDEHCMQIFEEEADAVRDMLSALGLEPAA